MIKNEVPARALLLLLSAAPAIYGHYQIFEQGNILHGLSFICISVHFAIEQFNLKKLSIRTSKKSPKFGKLQNAVFYLYLFCVFGYLAYAT